MKIEGKKTLEVFMRYNVAKERIEIKTGLNSNKIYKLPTGNNAEYKIGGSTYILDKINFEGKPIYGYFIEYFNGDELRLLLKPNAKIIPAKEAKTGYEEDEPARIEIEQKYYIVFKDGKVENVRLKNRDIRKVFDNKVAKSYLSDNDIDTVKDLVAFLKFQERNLK